jgi:hypothetical protein
MAGGFDSYSDQFCHRVKVSGSAIRACHPSGRAESEDGLSRFTFLAASIAVAGAAGLFAAPSTSADPLTPPTPAEVKYLNDLRRIFPGTRDSAEFRGDGELLELGWYVCRQRDSANVVGYGATGVSPLISQVAFIDLCPR